MKYPVTGEVWYADIPKEEPPHTIMRNRPCLVLDFNSETSEVMVIKLTSTEVRDQYDYRLAHWSSCGLKRPTTARTSKISYINLSQMKNLKGTIHPDDETEISDKLEAFLNS